MKVRVLIVEDEFIIADYMQECLQKFGYEVVDICLNYDEAIAALEKHKPDIALLDITLKGIKSGIDVGNYIKENFDIPFIFCTSHSDRTTIDTAKQTLPFAYLIKPFSEEDLYAVVETALMHYGRRKQKAVEEQDENPILINDAIFVKHKNKFEKISVAEILYVEANDNYAILHTANHNYVLKSTIKSILDILPQYFWRIHRSYIVNLQHLKSFDAEEVTIDNKPLPVGKSFYPLLLEKLKVVKG